MDPFLQLIELLRPQATLWTRVEASGRWGLSFRQREDLLFCWVERGMSVLVRPNEEPLDLRKDDFVLIRTSTPFSLLSAVGVRAEDSEAVIQTSGGVATLGDGAMPASTVLRGGRFIFDTANEQLLTGLLPALVHITRKADDAGRLATLLRLNESESAAARPGSNFVVARLMELVLVEVLRSHRLGDAAMQPGLVMGLADPVIAPALRALHSEVSRPWTVEALARSHGMSRSAFASRFTRLVGQGPIQYLQTWRLAIAKDELRRGENTIGEIAFMVGFQSSSAFSTAFTRAVGCSPRQFTDKAK